MTTIINVTVMHRSNAASRIVGAECIVPLSSPLAVSCEHVKKLDSNSLNLEDHSVKSDGKSGTLGLDIQFIVRRSQFSAM